MTSETETRQFLEADEWASESGIFGWLPRGDEDVQEATEQAAAEVNRCIGFEGDLTLTPVLMREESEVEAKINGHEFPLFVECTSRAKHAEPYWRIEGSRA